MELLSTDLASGTPLTVSKLLEPKEMEVLTLEPVPAVESEEVSPALPEKPAESVKKPTPVFKNPTRDQLSELAAEALAAGHSIFSFPPEPVPVSGPMYIYYNKKVNSCHCK